MKQDVYKLAEYLKIPKSILDVKPSADLWPGQTDEDEMGFTYDQLDGYLKGHKTDQKVIDKIHKLHVSTKHKRTHITFPDLVFRKNNKLST